MKAYHYLAGIIGGSLFCIISLHLLATVMPKMIIALAIIIAYPLIAIFMIWAESAYLTPQISDFPLLMLAYPVYFAVILSPMLIWIQQKKKAEQDANGDAEKSV